MAYIAMSCAFLFSLVLISSTNSAPVSQEQFFDNYERTEKYLQSCIPTLNVLFDTSTDPATSAGQPSIFREACPPESSQNPNRPRPRSNLCMLFAFRIHDMCQVSKAMQNNVNEFNTEMMKSFLQHSQTVMDEQKFCAEMTAPPPQGQSITLSRSETYYIRQAAGVQVALPLDPSTCSHLWKSMDCDQRELNSICQAYAFLATIEGPILESQKATLDTPGEPNEPQAPAEDNASDQSKTASSPGEQEKGVQETPDAELQPPSGEDVQLKNPVGVPVNEIPVGNLGNQAEVPVNEIPVGNLGNQAEVPVNEIPVGNPGNQAEVPVNEIPVGNLGNQAEVPVNKIPVGNSGNETEDPINEIPVGNPGNQAEVPVNEIPVGNLGNQAEVPVNEIPVGNLGNQAEVPVNEIPVGNSGNQAEVPVNEIPVGNLGNQAEVPVNEIPVGNPGNQAEVPVNEIPVGNLGNQAEVPVNEIPVGNSGNQAEVPINEIPVGNPGNQAEVPVNEIPVGNLGNQAEVPVNEIPVGNSGNQAEVPINETPAGNPGNPAEDPINPDVPNDWNRVEDGSEESSHIEDNGPGLGPPGDFGSNDDSSEGGYDNKNSEDDDGWEANQFENQDENHNIEPIPGNEENPGFQVQHPVEQNVKYDDGYDDDDAKTHFMAYSLTAIILILATYIMYHNKQKIIAVVVEGRNGRGRRRRGGSGYQKLDQNISEAMPSMHSQNA
ncbi:uncharacterized protein LOC753443 isoform X4 [Strongylocentrotus purpuratus]|uniref:Uncharacterized protein n=1 Tax=Strongylocentrotus purpuratus TaxID=7668 RepID=A0A7M7NIV9_STRPU|nr:uncharacterized protein LOC753443 isoform X4 [Strongylocentrotus purpuratus]